MLHAKGELLTIDVSSRTVSTTAIDEVLQSFVGGRGLGTRLAHERIPFDVDPLSADNRLYFTSGPMQQSRMSFTGRMNATSVSPLTSGLLSSNAGGYLSRNFVATGFSAVEILGQSEELLAVHVTDEGVDFRPVPDLAGATVDETLEHLEAEHDVGPDQTAVIGPAGENQVRFSAIMTSESRAFGRGGLGAVLGAKNVKAVTVDGESTPSVSVPETQMDVHREAAEADHIMKRQGTTAVVDLAQESNVLPTRYFSERSFEGAESINGDTVESKKYKRASCSQCAFGCKVPTRDDARGVETEGPEFETLMAFGSNAGVDDVVDVMQANDLCDDLGMDTISAGDVVAAYLASEDEFGDAALVHELVEKIARREGVGDLLAEGIDRIHEELGVENWSVKGMEFSAHDGRGLNGMGLGFATSNRGADHLYSAMYSLEYPLVDAEKALDPRGLEGKAEVVARRENKMAFLDSGIMCRFSRDFVSPDRLESLFDAPMEELLALGERIVSMERHFNNQRGMDRSADRLPYDLPGFEDALDRYYDHRGWTDDGVVPESPVTPGRITGAD